MSLTIRSRSLRAWTEVLPAFVLIGVIVISTTTGVGYGASWYDEQRILSSVALSIAALALLGGQAIEGRSSPLIVLALGLGLMSCAFAARSGVALREWSTYALMFFLVCSMRFDNDRRRAAVGAVLGSAIPAAYGAGVVANYVSSWLLGMPLGDETFLVGFANPRFPAQLEALTVPFLYVAFRQAPSRGWRIAACAVGVVWWMCLVGSGSRTAWMALFVAACVLSIAGYSCRRLVLWQLAIAALGALLYVVLFQWAPAFGGIEVRVDSGHFLDRSTIAARTELARIALVLIAGHPWLGVGPMHFAYVTNDLGAHPHNFWLQLAAEWGLPAATIVSVLTLLLFVRLLRKARAARDDELGPVLAASLGALIVWIVGTQSDGYMVVPTSQVASALVLAFAYRFAYESAEAGTSHGATGLTVSWRLIAVLAIAILATLPWSSFGSPTAREAAWRAENPGALLWPRFWQQGWIGPDGDPTAR